MSGDIPEPTVEVVDSLENAAAALEAIKELKACRGDVSKLRFGACSPKAESSEVSVETVKRSAKAVRVASSSPPV